VSRTVIFPFRTLAAGFPDGLDVSTTPEFSSTGPDPGANGEGSEFALGHDSDWNASLHDLTVQWTLKPGGLKALFGAGGIAGERAALLLAAEWTSPESGYRQLGEGVVLRLPDCSARSAPLIVSLTLGRGTLRGSGSLSLQVYLESRGPGSVRAGVATAKGSRLGTLWGPVTVVIDADSSLFPVVEEDLGAGRPLWEFRGNWTDALSDPFSADYLALVMNTGHPDIAALRDAQAPAAGVTPLMKQVLACWLAHLVEQIAEEHGDGFNRITGDEHCISEPGSIAHTLARLVSAGGIDTESPLTRLQSAQLWLDRLTRTQEAPA
jgi:hypothetical protein